MKFSSQQRTLIETAIETHQLPGVAAAIVKDGEILAAEGFGYRNIEQKLPMTSHTVIPVCSLTKSFTCTSIMQLVEAEKLWLDEPVITYLPHFRLADLEASRKITPRMLLCHKSGLGRTGHQDQMFKQPESPYKNRADVISHLAKVQLQTPPNTVFSYSNEGYAILANLVDTLSGNSLEAHLRSRIFDPVGMKQTFTQFDQWRKSEERAHIYIKNNDNYTEATLPKNYQVFVASGGLCSTVYDIALYQIATLNYAQSPLLSGGSLDTMQSVSNFYGDTGWGYGLGWFISWIKDTKIVAHSGRLPGVRSFGLLVPSQKIGVVVLINCAGGPAMQLAQELADTILKSPLFAQINQDDIAFKTRYPALDETALLEYTGTYNFEQKILTVSAEKSRLICKNDEGMNCAIAIGKDLFMHIQEPQIYYFLRAKNGKITTCLTGGRQFKKIE